MYTQVFICFAFTIMYSFIGLYLNLIYLYENQSNYLMVLAFSEETRGEYIVIVYNYYNNDLATMLSGLEL